MKVLHLIGGELTGGAAKGALWLHEGLRDIGISSRILTNGKDTLDSPDITSSARSPSGRVMNAIRSRVDPLPKHLYPNRNTQAFSPGIVGYPFREHPLFNWADIIHLHWINAAFVSIRHLRGIEKPLVWTMRDMWAFTGGCHIALDCAKYESGCGRCPQLGSSREHDLSRYITDTKERNIPAGITLVGISRWLSDCARKSYLFRDADVVTISNNISLREFFPLARDVARRQLNVPADRKIILAGAERPDAFWKGFDLLLSALPRLRDQQPFLLFFGNLDASLVSGLGLDYKVLGMVHDRETLRAVYSAADVFVAPSRMESFGKTLAEAMACGTPVVSFDATGPADIVDHRLNGYLAHPYDVDDLVTGISWILNHIEPDRLSKEAIKKAGTFDTKIVAQEYVDLYKRKLTSQVK